MEGNVRLRQLLRDMLLVLVEALSLSPGPDNCGTKARLLLFREMSPSMCPHTRVTDIFSATRVWALYMIHSNPSALGEIRLPIRMHRSVMVDEILLSEVAFSTDPVTA